MAILATDSTRFSGVVNMEYNPAQGFCRDVVTYNGTATTLNVGAVLGAYLASPTLVAGAVVGTGNGTVGTISVTPNAFLEVGVYTVKMLTATTFQVNKPNGGSIIGTGATGTAFSQNGINFTITAGGTAFVAGDTIPLTLSGTTKYKLVEATATDGTQVAKVVYIADVIGLSHPVTTVLNTDTTLLVLSRGPVIVEKGGLQFGASVNTAPLLATAYGQLASVGILCETTN